MKQSNVGQLFLSEKEYNILETNWFVIILMDDFLHCG